MIENTKYVQICLKSHITTLDVAYYIFLNGERPSTVPLPPWPRVGRGTREPIPLGSLTMRRRPLLLDPGSCVRRPIWCAPVQVRLFELVRSPYPTARVPTNPDVCCRFVVCEFCQARVDLYDLWSGRRLQWRLPLPARAVRSQSPRRAWWCECAIAPITPCDISQFSKNTAEPVQYWAGQFVFFPTRSVCLLFVAKIKFLFVGSSYWIANLCIENAVRINEHVVKIYFTSMYGFKCPIVTAQFNRHEIRYDTEFERVLIYYEQARYPEPCERLIPLFCVGLWDIFRGILLWTCLAACHYVVMYIVIIDNF